jgi:lysophospholipase L1-like esterase
MGKPRVKLGKDSRILLVGDSLAQGVDPHLRALAKDAGYPFDAFHKVSSRIDYWTGARLQEALDKARPTLAIVLLGTNDLAGQRPPALVEKDATALLEQLEHEARPDCYGLGLDVLWVSPLLSMQAPHPGAFNALSRAVAASSSGCGKAELFDSTALDIRLGADGVHPTATGYASWAGAIWKRIS